MQQSRPIQVNDSVTVSLLDGSYRENFIIRQIENNEIFISPINLPNNLSKLVLINGKWGVFGAENVDYQISFIANPQTIQSTIQSRSPVKLPPLVEPIVSSIQPSLVQSSLVKSSLVQPIQSNVGAIISPESIIFYNENPERFVESPFVQINGGFYPKRIHFKNFLTDDDWIMNDFHTENDLFGANDIVAPQNISLLIVIHDELYIDYFTGNNPRGLSRREIANEIIRFFHNQSLREPMGKLQNFRLERVEYESIESNRIPMYNVKFYVHS